MKIVVAYKWAADPQDAAVDPGGKVNWSRATLGVSSYDPVAVEMARKLADAAGGEVIGLTVGGAGAAAPKARMAAISRGLDRAVIVADNALPGVPSTQIAAVLAEAVRHIGDVDVILAGDSSVDIGAGMVPVLLAGELGWPAFSDVTEVSAEAGGLRVERSAPGGPQTLRVEGPAVLAAASDALVPRVPGMKDILAAGKKPGEILGLDALRVPALATELTVVSTSKPSGPARRQQRIDTSDPDAAAQELLAVLRKVGVL